MDQYSRLASEDYALKGENLVRYVISMRFRWLGLVERMQEGGMSKHLLHGHIIIGER